MIWLAIDNGISGSFAWVNDDCSLTGAVAMPVFSEQDYVKKKQNVTRIDTNTLATHLHSVLMSTPSGNVRVILERPFVNPGMCDLQREPEAFAKTFRARYLYAANAKVEAPK